MIAQIVQKLIAPVAGQGGAGQSAAKGDDSLPPSDGEGQFAGLMAEGGDTPLEDPIETASPTDPILMGAEAPPSVLPAAGAMALVWAGTIDASLPSGDALLGGDLVAGENLALGQSALAPVAGFAAAPFALGPDMAGDDSAQTAPVGPNLAQTEGAVEQALAAVKAVGAGVAAPIGAAQLAGSAALDIGADVQGAFPLPAELDQGLAVAGPSVGARPAGQAVTAAPLHRQSAHVDMAQVAVPEAGLSVDVGLGGATQIKVASAELPVAAPPTVDPNAGKAAVPAALAAMPGVAGIKGQGALGDGPRKDRIDMDEVDFTAPVSPAPNITQIAAQATAGQMGPVMAQPAMAQWWAADHAAPLGLGDGLGSAMAIGEAALRAQGGASAAVPAFAMPNPSTPIAAQLIPYAGAAQSGPVEVTLSPAELGHLKFEILHRGEGVQIVLSAERGDTLDLLRRNSDQLLADFRNAGFSGASLSFGGWGAGQGQSAPVTDEATAQDAPDSAQALAQSTAAFARAKPMLDPSRSLNLRL